MLQGFDGISIDAALTKSDVENITGLSVITEGSGWFSTADLSSNFILGEPAKGVYVDALYDGAFDNSNALYFFKAISDTVSRQNIALRRALPSASKNVNISLFISADRTKNPTPLIQFKTNNGFLSLWVNQDGELILSLTEVPTTALQSIVSPAILKRFSEYTNLLNLVNGSYLEVRIKLSEPSINFTLALGGVTVIEPINIPNSTNAETFSYVEIIIPSNYYFEYPNHVTCVYDDLIIVGSDDDADVFIRGEQTVRYVSLDGLALPSDWNLRGATVTVPDAVEQFNESSPYFTPLFSGASMSHHLAFYEDIGSEFTHYQLNIFAEVLSGETLRVALSVVDTPVQTEDIGTVTYTTMVPLPMVGGYGEVALSLQSIGSSLLTFTDGGS